MPEPELLDDVNRYLRKACPNLPSMQRSLLSSLLVSAIDEWVELPRDQRSGYVNRRLDEILGALMTGSASFEVIVGISKKQTGGDVEKAKQSAELYLVALTEQLCENAVSHLGSDTRQLSFKLGGVDLNHPRLSMVSTTVTGSHLNRKELLQARNFVRPRKGRNPGEVVVSKTPLFDALA